jgi:alanine dehydrogenase
MIGATYLTAQRTAAADAVSVRALARADASRLGVLGAGHQAVEDVRAIVLVRSIEAVFIWNRDGARAEAMAQDLAGDGLDVRVVGRESAVREADILVTATAAREPLVERSWVRPGTHISAMGADGPGKQELAIDLVAGATLVADQARQSVTIGEFQSAARAGRIEEAAIRALGDVLTGRAVGRTDDAEITIFDSSGIAIQDLAVCGLALQRARESGKFIVVD